MLGFQRGKGHEAKSYWLVLALVLEWGSLNGRMGKVRRGRRGCRRGPECRFLGPDCGEDA